MTVLTGCTPTNSAYRFRNDDGNETTATWMAAVNTNITAAAGQMDTPIRVRQQLFAADCGCCVTINMARKLYYKKNSGTQTEITTSSSPIKLVTSPNVADNLATTNQQGTPVGGTVFQAGQIESDGATASNTFLVNHYTEDEWVVQIDSTAVVNNDTITLYPYFDNGTGYGIDSFFSHGNSKITISKAGSVSTNLGNHPWVISIIGLIATLLARAENLRGSNPLDL